MTSKRGLLLIGSIYIVFHLAGALTHARSTCAEWPAPNWYCTWPVTLHFLSYSPDRVYFHNPQNPDITDMTDFSFNNGLPPNQLSIHYSIIRNIHFVSYKIILYSTVMWLWSFSYGSPLNSSCRFTLRPGQWWVTPAGVFPSFLSW